MERDSKGRFCKSKKGTERKYIKLGKPHIEDDRIKVVIEEQSHRGYVFGVGGTEEQGRRFKASNGITLCSAGCPEAFGKYIFLRGSSTSRDNEPLEFNTLEDYLKFEDAVKEYNEHFSKPQVKEVTMEELHKLLGYEVKIKEGK